MEAFGASKALESDDEQICYSGSVQWNTSFHTEEVIARNRTLISKPGFLWSRQLGLSLWKYSGNICGLWYLLSHCSSDIYVKNSSPHCGEPPHQHYHSLFQKFISDTSFAFTFQQTGFTSTHSYLCSYSHQWDYL